MENMELNNNAEMVQEVAEMAKIDMKTVGMIGLGVAAAGAVIYGGKKLWDKKIAPKFKKNKKEEAKTEE